jgi:F1F0 ATPase subunit 2
MTGLWTWIWPLVLGLVLGWLFFGGLWLSLKRLPRVRHPGLWTLGSFFLRLGVAGVGFYLTARFASWQGVLLCLAGFLVMHVLVTRWLGIADTGHGRIGKDGGYDHLS